MKRNTIAYLTRSLNDTSGIKMWEGVKEKCAETKTPLITFNGAELNKSKASILYHLFQPRKFAGVISWASSEVSSETVNFYNNFGSTPLICTSFQIPGHPVINADCKVGVEQMMEHLIKVHNIRKIAFIRGPDAHVYARDRYQGYLDSLHRNRIRFDDRLVAPHGGWAIKDGEKGIDYFLGKGLKPGKDFEAVICVGDNVAIGAQEHLQKKGYSIPHDVAVCGFNGTNEAAFSNPPITTVNMPFLGLGQKGFEMLHALTKGERLETDNVSYSTSLVIGQSCGCTSMSFKRANCTAAESSEGETKKSKKVKIFSSVKDLANPDWTKNVFESFMHFITEERFSPKEVIEFCRQKVSNVISEYAKSIVESDASGFFKNFELALGAYQKVSEDLSIWQDFASILREQTLPHVAGKDLRFTENTISQLRVVISEVNDRIQRLVSLQNARNETTLRQIGSALLTSYDTAELMNIMATSISKIGIPGVYVCLYKDSVYTEKNPVVAEKSRCILAVQDGQRLALPPDGIEFESADILPDNVMPEDCSLVVLSLHFQDTFMGYIAFESSKVNPSFYQALRDQLSCSLSGALLLEERTLVKQQIEATMGTMSEKADLISNHSQSVSSNVANVSQSMDMVATSIKTISNNLQTILKTVSIATNEATNANSAMEELVDGTKRISRAVRNISAIAERTNVLALNASIEAAHAGEAGKGFSIVAKEVKSLAAQTVSATEKIEELVKNNNERTEQTERIFNATTEAIKQIEHLSNRMQEALSEQVSMTDSIANQISNASSGVEDITYAIGELAALS